MKLPRIITTLAALCALALPTIVLTGCQNQADKAKDQAWIAKRAAVLQKQINPRTNDRFTPAQAREAAEQEQKFASNAAYWAMTGNDAALNKMWTPPSMTIAPSAQPAPMAPQYVPATHVETGGMTHCFVAGTPVQTPAGAREIQDIRVGDSVLSFNERSGKVEPARVSKVIVSKRSDLMVLTSPHGSVTCSQNHRFLTAQSRWTMASALSASDKVFALGTDFTGVVPIKCAARHNDVPTPVTVHNFEVEGNHDYFVGPDAILCHNTK